MQFLESGRILLFVSIIFSCLDIGFSTDDFYYMKACYPWFRPPEPRSNCTLRCSLNMPYVGVSPEEVAICLSGKDGLTGISCQSDSDCQLLLEGSYCKRASCLCEEKGLDRFYSLGVPPDVSMNFCTASSEIHSIHLPLVLFPWKTLMIVFGTLVFTGLLLMTLKWLSPIVSALREYHGTEARARTRDLSTPEPRPTAQDKPPSYETAVQLGDVLPSYEDAQRLPNVTLNVVQEPDRANATLKEHQQDVAEAVLACSPSTSDSSQPLLLITGPTACIVPSTSTCSVNLNGNSSIAN